MEPSMHHSSTLTQARSRRPVAENQACVRAIIPWRPSRPMPLDACPHGIEFTQVAMQLGRPQGAGVFCGIPVMALPGNHLPAGACCAVWCLD